MPKCILSILYRQIHLVLDRASLVDQMVKKKKSTHKGDPGSIPGSGRSPGEGNNTPLQYSCLENPMDRGAWRVKSVRSQSDGMTNTFTFPYVSKPGKNQSTFLKH